jgi:hypothetical protein
MKLNNKEIRTFDSHQNKLDGLNIIQQTHRCY